MPDGADGEPSLVCHFPKGRPFQPVYGDNPPDCFHHFLAPGSGVNDFRHSSYLAHVCSFAGLSAVLPVKARHPARNPGHTGGTGSSWDSVGSMKILVTGGTGYIGSHTVLSLQEAGHDVLVIDNLVNSSEESLRRVAELTGKTAQFHQVDLVDEPPSRKSSPKTTSTP
jgi:hypothetical protein